MLNVFSSCTVMLEGAGSAIAASTYPSEDSDMLAAEAAYCGLENELQSYLAGYESTHDYDEYHYDLDSIEHDPSVLISILTALRGGAWTIDQVQGDLQMLFDKQYILTEDVTTETRYRTETRTGTRTVTDPETGDTSEEEYEYDVQVSYTYTICNVKLENFNLSHVPVYIMGEDQLSMYATYMATLGNRDDLFPTSSYVNLYNGEITRYEIPPEALSDEKFAAMIAEAEKYLGYPYVWGGSSPSTSFDCSGFVSWVINHCGQGWDFGRLGSDGLYFNVCTPIPASEARPGDLIFFQHTYDTPNTSHVGIYVGNGMMIHCGNPIQYASINTSYWQQHFYGFGRLP
ncbi:MAG: C40 family peptidase [Oscillospiraceae bacterium]|nr:C40 family peptidase [Oscillospiraceae bacterium]